MDFGLKTQYERCASLTTLWGIIFLLFGFSQKACLNFEKQKTVLSTDSQIQQLLLFLVEKSAFLRHRKLSGQVAKPL